MASTIVSAVTEGVLVITVAGHGVIKLNPADYSDGIREMAMLHGFKQKIVDAAALSRNEATGASATAADKFQAMRDVEHQLLSGDWNRRATGGDGTATAGLLIAALVRVTGNDLATVRATVDAWSGEQQAAMRADPAVAPIIATIKAERAATKPTVGPKVDVGGLLEGLMGRAMVGKANPGELATHDRTGAVPTPAKVKAKTKG